MFKWVKGLYTPDILAMKKQELMEATINLGKAKSGVEFAQSQVTYNEARVKRLKTEIQAFETEIDLLERK